MFSLPVIAPMWAFVAYWALVGICPENWPIRWPPPPPPRGPRPPWPLGSPGPYPPPPWSRFLRVGAAVLGGFVLTSATAGAGLQSGSPVLDFAATGAFALASAVGARAVAAQFAPVPALNA